MKDFALPIGFADGEILSNFFVWPTTMPDCPPKCVIALVEHESDTEKDDVSEEAPFKISDPYDIVVYMFKDSQITEPTRPPAWLPSCG